MDAIIGVCLLALLATPAGFAAARLLRLWMPVSAAARISARAARRPGRGARRRRWTGFADLALATALLLAVAALVAPHERPLVVALPLALVVTVLVLLDARYLWLPDVVTLPLLGLGVLAASARGTTLDALLAALLGGLAMLAIQVAFRRLRGVEGLGLGDVKLVAAFGAWVGLQALPLVVAVASVSALAVVGGLALARRRMPSASEPIPFGAFLSVGFYLVWLALAWPGAPV